MFIKWGRIGVIVRNEVCVDLEERLYDERKICRLIMIEKYLVLFKYFELLEDFLNVYLIDYIWYFLLFFSFFNLIYICISY